MTDRELLERIHNGIRFLVDARFARPAEIETQNQTIEQVEEGWRQQEARIKASVERVMSTGTPYEPDD